MRLDRRRFLERLGAVGLASYTPPVPSLPLDSPTVRSAGDGSEDHARFMRLAIEEARKSELYPFGAVIVGSGRVLGRGVSAARENPSHHGEIVAMDDYVRRIGNRGWAGTTLYSTAEPCPMCMSACAWAGVGQVVWGTSIERLRLTGVSQIAIPARQVADAAESFYTPQLLLGGVLAETTDALFRRAQALRGGGMHRAP
jgi:tRNA(adenine34) deaminase